MANGETYYAALANARQVGGGHYTKRSYQHWDFVLDAGLPYLPAQATRYASRWKDKNGREDLEKCVHYIDKIKETGGKWEIDGLQSAAAERFADQFDTETAELIELIVMHKLNKARGLCLRMLAALCPVAEAVMPEVSRRAEEGPTETRG